MILKVALLVFTKQFYTFCETSQSQFPIPPFAPKIEAVGVLGCSLDMPGQIFLAGLNSLLELIDVLNSKDGVTVNFRNTHVEKFVGEEGLTRGEFSR